MNKGTTGRMAAVVIAAALAGMLQGAEEFEGSVPLDLAEVFLGLDEEGRLYRDLPEDFPLDAPPPGFEVLGTVVQGFSTSAYFETDVEDAEEAVADAFVAAGWLRLGPPFGGAQEQRGFVGRQSFEVPLQLCHENGDRLSVQSRADDRNIVVARHSRMPPQPVAVDPSSCTPATVATGGFTVQGGLLPRGELRAYMPRLVLPEEGNYYGRAPGTGTGGSGGIRDMETRTELSIDWEPERIYEHLAAQLAEQGWSPEDDWNTARVAGGSWTRTVDDRELLAVLTVIRQQDEEHFLRFRMVQVSE